MSGKDKNFVIEVHPDDLKMAKRAAVNHKIDVEIINGQLILCDVPLPQSRPQNFQLFALTVDAFKHSRRIREIWEDLRRHPVEADAAARAYMAGQAVAGPELLPKTNDEVFREAMQRLMQLGVIDSSMLDDMRGYPRT